MRDRSLAVWLAAVATLACSNREFRAKADGGTGGGAGTAGMGTSGGMPGGSGGAAGSGGGPNGGSAGTGGADPCGGCAPTTFCRGGQCLPCSGLSTLDFGPPEPLLDHPTVSIRFPRSGGEPDSLFFRAGDDGQGQLWYTPSTRQLGAFIGDASVNQQSGPLFVASLGRTFNLVFDETVSGTRTVRAASWNGSALGPDVDMPAPLSPGGFQDYSPAVATETGRLHWMSTRDGNVTLRTGALDSGEGDIVTIDVPMRSGGGTCLRSGEDATPWVTPAGNRMFFREFPFDEACQPIDARATDLYVVPLEPSTGMPTAPAVLLSSVSLVGSTETDPSLSPDFCMLYFASDAGSSGGPDFKLYRAARR